MDKRTKKGGETAISMKVAVFFLVIILTLFGIAKCIKAVSAAAWDGQHHINIAVDNGDLEIWSIEPSQKTVTRVVVQKDTYLSVASYGDYKVSAMSKLSMLERKNGSLLAQAISETLGVPIDGVLIKKDDASSPIDLRTYFGVGGLGAFITNSPYKTHTMNLTAYDLLRLWNLTFSLRKEGIEEKDLAQLQVLIPSKVDEKLEGYTIDTAWFTNLAKEYFIDKKVKEENKTVEVINGTEIAGRANTLAVLLTQIGANVINTRKGDNAKETIIYTAADSYTAKKIAKLISGKIIHEMPDNGRADIFIVLGEK